MKDVLTIIFMVGGSFFMLLAAIGVIRMPDLYTRMHAATKVGTVGVIGVMLAVALHFSELGTSTRSILIMLFFLITAPVAAHMIGRSAYLSRTPMWKGTVVNEWPGPKPEQEEGPDPDGESPKI